MTAEEKLKELYKKLEPKGQGGNYIEIKPYYISLSPCDIDLIANLVIERLRGRRE